MTTRPTSVSRRSSSNRRIIRRLCAAQPIEVCWAGPVELDRCAVIGNFLGCRQKSMSRV
jgi:hypothetical protein